MPLLRLDDGRNIHFETSGPVGETVLVFHHGQPGAALISEATAQAAQRRGWATVMLSRPGYAGSDRNPGRRVADVVGDVRAVLDHVGAGRFVTAGWSGGGPHALACGGLVRSRCAAVATLAGVAPFLGSDDLDFTAGMGPENVAEFEALAAGDPGVEQQVAEMSTIMRDVQADDLIVLLGGLISDPDRRALEGTAAAHFAESFRLSASSGHFGYWDDGQAYVNEWGFDLSAMEVPVRVWRAGQDLMVPPAHGEWLARHIPGAHAEYLPEEGHISLVTDHIEEIMDGLATDAGRT